MSLKLLALEKKSNVILWILVIDERNITT